MSGGEFFDRYEMLSIKYEINILHISLVITKNKVIDMQATYNDFF